METYVEGLRSILAILANDQDDWVTKQQQVINQMREDSNELNRHVRLSTEGQEVDLRFNDVQKETTILKIHQVDQNADRQEQDD